MVSNMLIVYHQSHCIICHIYLTNTDIYNFCTLKLDNALLCADLPFPPTITEHFVVNWEQLRVAWHARYNPVYNTTYTAWFWNRYRVKYYSVSG